MRQTKDSVLQTKLLIILIQKDALNSSFIISLGTFWKFHTKKILAELHLRSRFLFECPSVRGKLCLFINDAICKHEACRHVTRTVRQEVPSVPSVRVDEHGAFNSVSYVGNK